jgi:plasmid stabilization system protein ParE
MRRLNLRRAAYSEFYDAIAWYDARDPDRGEQFADAVAAVFQRVLVQPDFFARIEGDVREAPVSGYPYRVFFIDQADLVVVVAILHVARDPAQLRRRIADQQ